jgi:hypothetical protein
VDRGSFRRLLKFCRPSLSERDIPHRQKLRAEIVRRAAIVEGSVRENLKNVPSKISFTFDAWTSAPGDPYLSLTAHYIAAPIDRPNAWELKTDQLLFQEIQGRHTGKNMGDILSRALDRYDLHGKVRSLSHSPLNLTDYLRRLDGLPVMVRLLIARPFACSRTAPQWMPDGQHRNMTCCECPFVKHFPVRLM